MSLEQKVKDLLAEAMKTKDRVGVRAYRDIHTNLLKEKNMLRVDALTEGEEIRVLQRVARQNRELHETLKSSRLYGNEEAMKFEEAAVALMERLLPEKISSEELHARLKEIIAQSGANSVFDMPRVIKEANEQLAGKADGGQINKIVKQLLTAM